MLDLTFACVGIETGYSNELTLDVTQQLHGINAAPAAFAFETTVTSGSQAIGPGLGETYDPLFHEILYMTTFGDDANSAPITDLNMPAAWKDINKGYGRRTRHVFNDPGTYTVSHYAYEPKTRRFGYVTQTVTVLPSSGVESVLPGNQTIIVDPAAGDHSALHPGATIVADWSAARSARNALGATLSQILFASGYMVPLSDANSAASTNTWGNARIGALDPNGPACGFIAQGKHLGGKNNAIIKDEGNLCVEHVYFGLTMIGEWDPTTERGRLWDPFYTDKDSEYTGGPHLLMHHRCNYSGFEGIRGYNVSSKVGLLHLAMFNECTITNWQDYGLYLEEDQPGSVAIIGSSIKQNPNALSGGAKNNMYNGHGPVRSSNNSHVYIAVCDLFSRTGWSNGNTFPPVGGIRTANQACLRINTIGHEGKFSYVERVKLEGGMWYKEQDTTGGSDEPGNHVIDKVLQILGADNNLEDDTNSYRHGGTTIRNMLTIKLDHPVPGTANLNRFIVAGAGNGGPENQASAFNVYNCTIIDLRTPLNGADLVTIPVDVQGFAISDITNNAIHRPFATSPVDEGLDTSTAFEDIVALHRGPRFGFLHQEGSFASDVAPGGSFEVPYSMITDALYNLGENLGSPTNQTDWQAIAGIDTNHWIHIGSVDTGARYFADDGQIAVTPTATGLQITNNTLDTWASGATWRFKPARDSLLPDFDPQYSSQGRLIPTGAPLNGSPVIDAGDTGTYAYDDFFGNERPTTGREAGALQQ